MLVSPPGHIVLDQLTFFVPAILNLFGISFDEVYTSKYIFIQLEAVPMKATAKNLRSRSKELLDTVT